MESFEENPWTFLSSERKYENPWIAVNEHQVLKPNGQEGIYGVVHFKNVATGVIALDENENIYLVGQYRYPLKEYSWEIPEGGGDPRVNPLISIQRELLEETGLTAANWEPLMEMRLSNSVTDERAFIFVARDLSQQKAQPEDTEVLKIKKIPFEEALQQVLEGEMTDSMTVAGILKYKILKEHI